mgnify:CR=1 FL=1
MFSKLSRLSPWVWRLVLGVACVAAALLARQMGQGAVLLYGLALPLDLLGQGLRRLSLLGGFCNILAWALYGLLCLLPTLLGVLAHSRGKGKGHWWMGIPLSLCLFYFLYRFINPALLSTLSGDGLYALDLLQGKILSALVCWSAGAAWFGLWLLRRTERLQVLEGLSLVLELAGLFLLVELCYVRVYALAGCLVSTGIQVEGDLASWGPSLLFSGLSPVRLDVPRVLNIILNVIPCICLLVLLSPARRLLQALGQDPYGAEVAPLCSTLAAGARRTVYACLFVTFASNLFQLALLGQGDVQIRLVIPLMELFLALGLLLLADWAKDGRALKLDNESII